MSRGPLLSLVRSLFLLFFFFFALYITIIFPLSISHPDSNNILSPLSLSLNPGSLHSLFCIYGVCLFLWSHGYADMNFFFCCVQW